MQGWVLASLANLSISVILLVSTILKKLDLLSSYAARKLVHVSVGFSVLFFLPYHEDTLMGRFWGASCVALFAIIFFVFGCDKIKGFLTDFLTTSVCRSESASEMQKGPMIYCVSMTLIIFIFWKSYPPSIIGLMVMVTGDGFAEVVGRKFGTRTFKNPWGEGKTLEGILTVVFGGMLGSILMCYHIFGQFYVFQSFIGGLLGAVVEFYSPPNLDNLFIPIPILSIGFLLI